MAKKDERDFGVSTDPGDNYMDKVQEANQEGKSGPNGENMNVPVESGEATAAKESRPTKEVELDRTTVEILDPEEVKEEEHQQVQPADVIFVPHKDFEARIN